MGVRTASSNKDRMTVRSEPCRAANEIEHPPRDDATLCVERDRHHPLINDVGRQERNRTLGALGDVIERFARGGGRSEAVPSTIRTCSCDAPRANLFEGAVRQHIAALKCSLNALLRTQRQERGHRRRRALPYSAQRPCVSRLITSRTACLTPTFKCKLPRGPIGTSAPINRLSQWRFDGNSTIATSMCYGMIVAQVCLAGLYAGYGVPDTVEGRFELLVLHLVRCCWQCLGARTKPAVKAITLASACSMRFAPTSMTRSAGRWASATWLFFLAGCGICRGVLWPAGRYTL